MFLRSSNEKIKIIEKSSPGTYFFLKASEILSQDEGKEGPVKTTENMKKFHIERENHLNNMFCLIILIIYYDDYNV
jgi:hypothetical protein